MELSSPVFENKRAIPKKYSCDGENINPPLRIKEVPSETASLALMMDDPDAANGLFTHWLVWCIAPSTEVIGEGSLPVGACEGETSFGETGYGGPCPPDKEHRYFFRLYALDSEIDVKPGATRAELEAAIKPHIIAEAELMGTYKREEEELAI